MGEGTLQHYRTIMADKVRMRAYERAIAAVCPDRVVCEIGVGLGPLSLMALRTGARRVYGIEMDAAALSVAERVARRNGFDDSQFVPVHGLSHQVSLPEQADVVISEILSSSGVGENISFYVEDARQRMLAPGGTLLPRSLTCFAALGCSAEVEADLEFWRTDLRGDYGIDYGDMLPFVRGDNMITSVRDGELRSDWQTLSHIDFARPTAQPSQLSLQFAVTRPGPIGGIFTAFETELAPGVRLGTKPEDPETHWKQGFTCFERPIECEAGDRVAVVVSIPRTEEPRLYLEVRALHFPLEHKAA